MKLLTRHRTGAGGLPRSILLWAALAALGAALGAAQACCAASASARAVAGSPSLIGLSEAAPTLDGSARARAVHSGVSLTPSTSLPYWACPEGPCNAIVDPPPVQVKVRGSSRYELPDGGPLLEGSGEKGGFDPQDLQSAYNIPATGGAGHTIALIDAYGYPTAEEDLAKYRERYGLEGCTKASGCFRKLNQAGEEGSYPAQKGSWETESALDMEMASAACQQCHIMLVEANSASAANLAAAEETAARLGATEISNSWGNATEACEAPDCEEEDAYFEHPGVLITVSAGDEGYDGYMAGGDSPSWPATLPDVVSVGGTSLKKASGARGWSEEVWFEPERAGGSGGGCSTLAKPSWQSDAGCAGRTDNDVAAVAACQTPVSTYSIGHAGWANVCGTSVSAPLIAGIEAHASAYARSLPGADTFYSDPAAAHDVTAGSSGECTPPSSDAYLCNAQPGYDAPSGTGTPAGPLELLAAPPAVATRAPSAIGAGTATLTGAVDPQGSETDYHFEYGTTTAYGTSAPSPAASLGSGTGNREVSQGVVGLAPSTTYHYRLVAANGAGTSYGADRTLTTSPPTVTRVTPASGPYDGASAVTITGTNFENTTAVEFGSREASSFALESETQIRAVSPSGSGTVDVTVTTPAGTSAASSADQFTYELGAILAWGRNEGRLGDGTSANSDVPVEASGLPEAAALAAGEHLSLAVLKSGALMAWGENVFGEVGDGSHTEALAPVHVCAAGVAEAPCPHGPYLEEVAAVAVGAVHSLALLKNGTVVAWGGNIDGQLGSDTARSDAPVPVCTTIETPCAPEHELKEVVAVAAGAWYSLALLKGGTVMAWGENADGQLGDGSSTGPESCEEKPTPCSRIPIAVSHLSEVSAIAAGAEHSLALLKGGTVMAWGRNLYGELGDGNTANSDVPVAVCAVGNKKARCKKHLSRVLTLAAGSNSSLALLAGGSVDGWGSNAEGQLGTGSKKLKKCAATSCAQSPIALAGLSEVAAIASDAASAGADGMALLHGGTVLAWGGGSYGDLGNGSETGSGAPVRACAAYATHPCPAGPYLSGEVTAIAAGGEHQLVSVAQAP